MTPKLMEAWFNLMSEAMRGSTDAQQVIRAMSNASSASDETMRMMTRFMPPGIGPIRPDAFNEWLEDWWRMMGVVPRYRYLELLERYELLRSRLEESEKTTRRLQSMIGEKRQEEAQKMLDFWGTTLEETLKAQTEWMQAWMPTAPRQERSLEEKEKSEEKNKE